MINVGVIGCGKIAQTRHLPEYAANENCIIAGLFDANENRAREMAEKYNSKFYHSFEDLLLDESIDAVSICVANHAHCEMTVSALKAGKHVFCEKPMATTLEECELMVRTAQDTGKYLMIGHNQRLAKAHAFARKLIADGEIGNILTFTTKFGHQGPESWTIDAKNNWFFDKKLAAFGAIADLGIHKTDLIQFLTNQKIIEVTSYIGTLDKRSANGNLIGVDDNTICIYKLSGGAVGTMTVSWTYYGSEDNSTILYGTDGIMYIYDDPNYSIKIEKRNGDSYYYDLDKIQTNTNQTKSGIIDLWLDCLVKRTPPDISGEDALFSMRAIFGAIESAMSGRKIIL